MSSTNGIIVIGNSCIDEYRFSKTTVVEWGNKIEAVKPVRGGPFFGGAACNITAALTAMGCERIRPLTAVGDDDDGNRIRSYFEDDLGVPMDHIKLSENKVSAKSIVLVYQNSQENSIEDGSRIIVVLGRSPLQEIDKAAIEEFSADWVVLSSLGDVALAREAYEYVANKEDLSLLSILGKFEIEKIKNGELTLPEGLKQKKYANSILVLNKEEFRSLIDQYKMLYKAFKEIIITDGPNKILTNCDSYGESIDYGTFRPNAWCWIPAAKADVVDTTGAGDLFCAGYLNARRLGVAKPDAVKFASVVSSFGISKFGAHAGVREIQKIKVDTKESVLQCVHDYYKVPCEEIA